VIGLSGKHPSKARPYRVRGAAKRATPRLRRVRAWVAPRVERGGLAVQDTIAPKISGLLSTAARKLDPAPPQRRRQWPRVLAGTVMVAAAAGVTVTVVRRRRRANELADDLAYAGPDRAGSADRRAEPGYRSADADLAASPEQAKVNGQLQPS
jgi:hypothetical protein